MGRYLSVEQAAADGITIVHEAERQRYALYVAAPPGSADPAAQSGPRLVGEARYSLIGDEVIDFDSTVVSPELRGTGLSGLLARAAFTGDAVADRHIATSCWFMAGYLEKHPELRAAQA